MDKSNIISAVMGIGMVGLALLLCGSCFNEETRANEREAVRLNCIVHLHQAGKAFNLAELQSELAQGVSCLKEIRNICDDSNSGFKEKLEVIQKLQEEVTDARNSSFVPDLPKQEALLAKTNRLLFNQGIACYKGNCQYKVTTFICNDVRRTK